MTGFGCTETAPFALSTGADGAFAGMIGLPAPGLELKLAPVGAKLEARVRGPNITPGYWRDETLTQAAFDEEGFYRLGDAMRFVDPADPRSGLIFDGRLAEDFKLSTGTWVSVGPLRARILAQARRLRAGRRHHRPRSRRRRRARRSRTWPPAARWRRCRRRAGARGARRRARRGSVPGGVRRARAPEHRQLDVRRPRHAARRAAVARRARGHRQGVDQPAGVLQHRAALVDELYAATPPPRVIVARA